MRRKGARGVGGRCQPGTVRRYPRRQHRFDRGFKILSETGIGAGVRRVEAVTGDAMLRHFFRTEELLAKAAAVAKTQPELLAARIEELQQQLKEQKSRAEKLESKLFKLESGALVGAAVEVDGIKVLARRVDAADMAALRTRAEQVLAQMGGGVVILGAVQDGKVNLAATAGKDALARGVHCGKLIGAVAREVGGGGGGRPDMAQAGGKDPSRLEQALALAPRVLQEQIAQQ